MTPTLRQGDGLEVLPCPPEAIRVGDVIVFSSGAKDSLVVHRVIAIEPDGLRTRGDNNTQVDKDLVLWENVLGKAVSARRNAKIHRLANGPAGATLHAWRRIHKPLRRFTYEALGPVYRWMARTSIAKRYRSKLPPVQALYYRREGGVEIRLYQGKKLLGRRPANSNSWRMRRWHRFLIDLSELSLDDAAGPDEKPAAAASASRLENKI